MGKSAKKSATKVPLFPVSSLLYLFVYMCLFQILITHLCFVCFRSRQLLLLLHRRPNQWKKVASSVFRCYVYKFIHFLRVVYELRFFILTVYTYVCVRWIFSYISIVRFCIQESFFDVDKTAKTNTCMFVLENWQPFIFLVLFGI